VADRRRTAVGAEDVADAEVVRANATSASVLDTSNVTARKVIVATGVTVLDTLLVTVSSRRSLHATLVASQGISHVTARNVVTAAAAAVVVVVADLATTAVRRATSPGSAPTVRMTVREGPMPLISRTGGTSTYSMHTREPTDI